MKSNTSIPEAVVLDDELGPAKLSTEIDDWLRKRPSHEGTVPRDDQTVTLATATRSARSGEVKVIRPCGFSPDRPLLALTLNDSVVLSPGPGKSSNVAFAAPMTKSPAIVGGLLAARR